VPGRGESSSVIVLPESSKQAASKQSSGPKQTSASKASSGPKPSPGPKPQEQRAAATGARPAATPAKGSLAASVFCTNCGRNLGPQHRFCGFCGTPVE
jgi:hypothetical protein